MILDLKIHEHSMNHHLLFCQGYLFPPSLDSAPNFKSFCGFKKMPTFSSLPLLLLSMGAHPAPFKLEKTRQSVQHHIFIVSLQERFHQLSNDLTTYFFLDFHDLVQRLRFSVFLLIDLFLKRTQRSWAKSQPRTFDDIYHHHFNVFRFWVLGILLLWYLAFSPFGRPCVTGPTGPFTRTRGRGFAATCKWIAGKCCKNRSRDPSKLSRK